MMIRSANLLLHRQNFLAMRSLNRCCAPTALLVGTQTQSFSSIKPKPKNAKKNLFKIAAPHTLIALGLLATSNAHLVLFPMTTAVMHYLYHFNHFKKLTLYSDLSKLNKDENFVVTFEQVRTVLLTDQRFNLLIEQRPEFTQGDKERSSTLLFENPIFEPFTFKTDGVRGKIDSNRTRYSFTCHFKDLQKNSVGKISALIIFDRQKEAYFESLTVTFSEPREYVFKMVESDEDLSTMEQGYLGKLNMPDKIKPPQPKVKPRTKYTQY